VPHTSSFVLHSRGYPITKECHTEVVAESAKLAIGDWRKDILQLVSLDCLFLQCISWSTKLTSALRWCLQLVMLLPQRIATAIRSQIARWAGTLHQKANFLLDGRHIWLTYRSHGDYY